MTRPCVIGLITLVILTWQTPTATQTARVRITGMFTDMRYIAEAGDLVGTEVFIVAGARGYVGVVQFAEGAPVDPVVVPLTVKGTAVTFEAPILGQTLKFNGHVTERALVGTFGIEQLTLPRRASYWQR